MSGRGEPVITDFGLALRASVSIPAAQSVQTIDHESRLTQSGVLLGTPAYMSPEQARGDVERIGPASDVYALGAILFELLTGKPPFPPVPLVDMVRLIENEPAPAPSAIRRGVPAGLDAICRKAMAKAPAERFPSMDAFADALAPFAAKSGGRRWRQFAVAAALAIVLALAGGVIYVQTESGTIEIRLNEPAANVQVLVDGNEIQLTDRGRVTKLRSGPHGLEIKGPDFETIARTFKVYRGRNPVLEVELRPKTKVADAKTEESLTQNAQRLRLASLLAQGERLIAQSRNGKAVEVVEEAFTLAPDSPTALGLRALLRIGHGDKSKARADAEAALKLNPETFQALLALSILNAEEGKADAGIAAANAAIRLRSDNAWAWSGRAKAFLDKKEFRQAIADATQAINIDLTHAPSLLTRGAAYANLGDYDKALADYDAVLASDPKNAGAFAQRALVHTKMGSRAKAEADWKKANALNPAIKSEVRVVFSDPPEMPLRKKLSADKIAQVGELLAAIERNFVQGGPQDVLKIADEALLIDPTSPAAHSARARALTELDRHREALAEAEKALPLAPKDAWLYVSRGVARGAMTEPVAAIPDLTIAITIAPANAYAWGNRGFAYGLRGQYYQAVADLNKAIALKSVSQFHMNRGSSYVFLGEYAKALADYETTAKLDPDNAQWRMICSVLRSRLGDTDGARKDREMAIKIDPTMKDVPPMQLPAPLPPLKLDPVVLEESRKK
ncbi:MAG: tetratricopeptide repeat protein [Planctomycetes bacterium]|nr:tetratricopeptide repeat protein [Planctomycetota bacterium]